MRDCAAAFEAAAPRAFPAEPRGGDRAQARAADAHAAARARARAVRFGDDARAGASGEAGGAGLVGGGARAAGAVAPPGQRAALARDVLRFYDWCAAEADRLARRRELRCEAHWHAAVGAAADEHGRTPLHYAACAPGPGRARAALRAL